MNPINISLRQYIFFLSLLIFIINLAILNKIPENIATWTSNISFLILIFGIGWAIAETPNKKSTLNLKEFDISYTYNKINVIPISSVIFTSLSLTWLFIAKIFDSGIVIAGVFFIGFGLLAAFEFMYRWLKQTKYNNFTFSFYHHGIYISRGEWSKEFVWNNYKSFSTVYKARFGKIVSYIPFLSMLVHKSDQYIINLYRSDQYLQSLKENPEEGKSHDIYYDQITTLPKNHIQVINYIKKHLKEELDHNLNQRL